MHSHIYLTNEELNELYSSTDSPSHIFNRKQSNQCIQTILLNCNKKKTILSILNLLPQFNTFSLSLRQMKKKNSLSKINLKNKVYSKCIYLLESLQNHIIHQVQENKIQKAIHEINEMNSLIETLEKELASEKEKRKLIQKMYEQLQKASQEDKIKGLMDANTRLQNQILDLLSKQKQLISQSQQEHEDQLQLKEELQKTQSKLASTLLEQKKTQNQKQKEKIQQKNAQHELEQLEILKQELVQKKKDYEILQQKYSDLTMEFEKLKRDQNNHINQKQPIKINVESFSEKEKYNKSASPKFSLQANDNTSMSEDPSKMYYVQNSLNTANQIQKKHFNFQHINSNHTQESQQQRVFGSPRSQPFISQFVITQFQLNQQGIFGKSTSPEACMSKFQKLIQKSNVFIFTNNDQIIHTFYEFHLVIFQNI